MRRVVITGAGTVNPLGLSVNQTFAALRAGNTAIGALDIPDLERLSVRIGAQVRGFDPETRLSPRQISLCDRFAQFALVAAQEAVAQAGEGALAPGAGVVLGTAGGGVASSEAAYRAVFADGSARVHPFTVPRLMANAATSHLSMAFELRGPSFTVSTACAASNHAIGLAFHMVRSGAVPVMLAGGSEAMLSFGGIKAWEGLRVLSSTGCRPFCATRDGLVMGEGAGVFVLEERDRALARGARVLAEVVGFGMTADAGDIVVPDPAGAEAAMQAALDDGGLNGSDIGYINAHGTGTMVNDRSECSAIRKVFGSGAERIAISSTKSLHGHLIGAAGAVELIAVLLALGEGVIAPTAGHRTDDPECALDIVTHQARAASVGAALSNAFAFGGLNAVLALKAA
ncbi:beta-ketoacyl-[acyl-carrier-protein] synthase family protein [Defluviimonas sp. WL0002]|uniref:Nodulation protein E n=1 Tax=Albidovulum marisflavi TaxID=2984159 RepID=A0ABT2ZFQ9_9RHOB|nr:beta-ketoacyl-[acyl-carrier-protein] synthase family protein [Defluviimonas sp. WL0002]MCV2869946.1 beta-ketoacyl-[acyl-carrier-protein] synthase family protein [Defluviimonas sp. WL0002]